MSWSLPVTQGVTEILAAQYNYLRLDVLDTTDGHSHTGDTDGGKKVQFSDLAYDDLTAPSGLNNSLSEIDAHIGATAGTGGSGVHGLHASAYVLGGQTDKMIILRGYISQPDGATDVTTQFSPFVFTSPPEIFLTVHHSSSNAGNIPMIRSRSTTQFVSRLEASGSSGYSWMAIGQVQ